MLPTDRRRLLQIMYPRLTEVQCAEIDRLARMTERDNSADRERSLRESLGLDDSPCDLDRRA
jgi:hypothetical protein